MAITWEIQITNPDVFSGRADVTAVRTDSETSKTDTYSFSKVVLSTAQYRAKLLNTIKTLVVEKAAKDNAIETFVSDLEAAGKTALENWEATR